MNTKLHKQELIDQRTGQHKIIIPQALMDAGLKAGFDMSGYAVAGPIPTIDEKTIYKIDDTFFGKGIRYKNLLSILRKRR
jgi:hypothetical protein